jgi:hypothetical protein
VQAEYARVPFADNSVYKIPDELTDEQVLFLADILPISYEVGVLNGVVSPGDVVSRRTVETQRARIHRKLGMRTRAELVRHALARHLIGA